jgi:hypothetical protein
MPKFSLTTTWLIPASIEDVWSCLIDTQTWPSWWKYVASVDETATGESSGLDNIRRYYWRTCLPYSLVLDLRIIEIEPCQRIVAEVKGDLQGEGRCYLCLDPITGHTQIEFCWQVQTCRPWMNWLHKLTRPIFAWNHNRVMKHGEQSLIRYLSTIKKH